MTRAVALLTNIPEFITYVAAQSEIRHWNGRKGRRQAPRIHSGSRRQLMHEFPFQGLSRCMNPAGCFIVPLVCVESGSGS